jgi:hypothetical protein
VFYFKVNDDARAFLCFTVIVVAASAEAAAAAADVNENSVIFEIQGINDSATQSKNF